MRKIEKSNKVARKPGPAKVYEERVLVTLTSEQLAAIDAARLPNENRVALIRSAIAGELQRRER